jgi:hypothetical protein
MKPAVRCAAVCRLGFDLDGNSAVLIAKSIKSRLVAQFDFAQAGANYLIFLAVFLLKN